MYRAKHDMAFGTGAQINKKYIYIPTHTSLSIDWIQDCETAVVVNYGLHVLSKDRYWLNGIFILVFILPSEALLTHCGRVTQICVFNTVKLGTSTSSP